VYLFDTELVLASSSPRRRLILENAGFRFRVAASSIEEKIEPDIPPEEQARSLALAKARQVAGGFPDRPVIGADTLVMLGSRILGKPGNRDEAREMLRLLSGEIHKVFTGLALVWRRFNLERSVCEVTEVTFRRLTTEEIEDYVATGEPLDKAGAYGIQGRGSTLVSRINGCFYNVMGLPVSRLTEILQDILAAGDREPGGIGG